MPAKKVVIVAFNKISPFHLSVPGVVFTGAQMAGEAPRFTLNVCSGEPGPLRSSDGFWIVVEESLDGLQQADIVIVPSWRDPEETPPEPLQEALRAAHLRGTTIVGLCLGTYVLAAAGLLDHRPATTHWMWTEDLSRRYPSIQVRPDVLYVDDDDIVTSAGVAAGIDCCLHIVRRYHGAEIANRVARRIVVPPHRQGGQAQFVEQLVRTDATPDKLSQLLEWVQKNLDQPHDIDSLARRSMMSRRTFTRRMRQLTGTSVGTWLLNQRLMLAQRLLESASDPIDQVAQKAGFGSEVSLRHHFRKTFDTTPSRYRKEFRGSAQPTGDQ